MAQPLEIIPAWCFLLYDLSHSLLLAVIAVLLVFWKRRELAFAMLAWPFHTRHYFPTKIFYPLSDYFFDGIAWSSPVVWFPNVAGVVLVVIYRLWSRAKERSAGWQE